MSRKKQTTAFTLIELMVVVCILGVLASVAIPVLGKYLQKAKTSEATLNLRKIYDGEVAYYIEEHVTNTGMVLTKNFVWLASVPSYPPGIEKRWGNFEDFDWPAIKFTSDSPLYYIYGVATCPWVADPPPAVPPVGSCPPTNAFEAYAVGDLDGDGKFSLYERLASVDAATGEIVGNPGIYVLDELE
jgi:prepilin-type N-terminal cleavage/methylation domain-containing protein